MFQFPGLPPTPLCVHGGVTRLITRRGFPIRTSSAQRPRAAPRGISLLRHVLHRHERPRHPPDARCHGLSTRRGVAPVAMRPSHSLALMYTHCAPTPTFARQRRAAASSSLLVSLRCYAAVPDCCLTRARQQAITTSKENGGDEETRTPDPLRAKEVLSQLSYIPKEVWWAFLDSNQRPHPYQGCALTN
jgi:hypothetical protein